MPNKSNTRVFLKALCQCHCHCQSWWPGAWWALKRYFSAMECLLAI